MYRSGLIFCASTNASIIFFLGIRSSLAVVGAPMVSRKSTISSQSSP